MGDSVTWEYLSADDIEPITWEEMVKKEVDRQMSSLVLRVNVLERMAEQYLQNRQDDGK